MVDLEEQQDAVQLLGLNRAAGKPQAKASCVPASLAVGAGESQGFEYISMDQMAVGRMYMPAR
jgi:hypothetical protein